LIKQKLRHFESTPTLSGRGAFAICDCIISNENTKMDADFFLLNNNDPFFEELVKDENDQAINTYHLNFNKRSSKK